MEFNIDATIQGLSRIAGHSPDGIVWVEEDPWVMDALRGSVLETGWRGTLTEYLEADEAWGLWDLSKRAIARLQTIESVDGPMIWSESMTIPPIGLGTYGWKYDPAIIREALDCGIRFIDTAETYGYGRVEKALGEELQDILFKLLIATKVSRNHLSYQSVLNACDRSLDRMKIPNVDLYQVHKPNPKYPIADTMRAMVDLLDSGRIKMVGVCNYSVDQVMIARQAIHPHMLRSVQVRYNLLDRGIERALIPYCQSSGIMIIAYSPLGQKFYRILEAPGAEVLKFMASEYGATEAQIALAWIMTQDGVVPIPRTNNLEHVAEIADAVQIELESADLDVLDAAFPVAE